MLQPFFRPAHRWLLLIAVIGLSLPAADAQGGPPFNTTVPSQIMDQFRNSRILWTTNVFVYANTLFGILAVIEFAWSAAVMLLEKSDLQAWTSALIRKLMWIGAFYALLLNGGTWIPAIIDSFTQIGQNTAGLGALSPSGVFIQGLSIAGALLDGASTSAFFTNPGPSLSLAFAALVIVISYTLITINFIVTLVESYLAVSVGFIFLGFGGSRWTAPYTERYIGLAVSIGIKIVVLYCLISAGFNLSLAWVDEAQGISAAARPVMTAFDVMGGSLIFMMCCWQIPKLFAAVIGGSPALTGGDLIATGAAVAAGGIAAGGAAASAVGLLAGAGGGAAVGTGSAASAGGPGSNATRAVASVGSASSSGGGPVSPPSPPSSPSSVAPNGAVLRAQPDPPSTMPRDSMTASEPPITSAQRTSGLDRNESAASAQSPISSILSSIGGEPLTGSGFEAQPPQRGFLPASVSSEDVGAASVNPSSAITRDTTPSDTPGMSSASEITSVRSASSPSVQPPTSGKAKNVMTRAVDQARSIRQRIRSLPSDSAPHATPPRIPIDHEE
ncbi:MAG TPA: P-type conjugative transfer protein TrbL [Bryobacteraceae bacterium]|nr:P-type conjugative transfer protein TrbL [Bryobacteraceae bacterium]HUA83684.1 P-type conjugative transfer protein TrbL [Bryobacteraceae bacterium]